MNKNFDSVLINIIQEVNKEADAKKRLFIFYGFSKFKEHISEKYIPYYNSLFEKINLFKNAKFILVDDYESFKNVEIENWYASAVNDSDGIWIGDGVDEQMLIKFDDIPDDVRKQSFGEKMVVCDAGKPVAIKHVILEAKNE